MLLTLDGDMVLLDPGKYQGAMGVVIGMGYRNAEFYGIQQSRRGKDGGNYFTHVPSAEPVSKDLGLYFLPHDDVVPVSKISYERKAEFIATTYKKHPTLPHPLPYELTLTERKNPTATHWTLIVVGPSSNFAIFLPDFEPGYRPTSGGTRFDRIG